MQADQAGMPAGCNSLRNMTTYKSKSGLTALQIKDEITAVYGCCYRLESRLWHHVGDTEPFDPATDPQVLERLFQETVENLDQQDFDLSKSMAEIPEKDFP
jgi:hypothetical protein